jgi:tetratricopeptide (TPR) repeat protein
LHVRQAIGIPYDKENQQSINFRAAALQSAADGIQGDSYYQSLVLQELVQMNLLDQSIALLKRTISNNPKSYDSYAQLADLYEQTRRATKALPYRREMIQLDPKNWQLWYYYAVDLEASGEKGKAKDAYTRVLSMNPKSAEAETSTAALSRLG